MLALLLVTAFGVLRDDNRDSSFGFGVESGGVVVRPETEDEDEYGLEDDGATATHKMNQTEGWVPLNTLDRAKAKWPGLFWWLGPGGDATGAAYASTGEKLPYVGTDSKGVCGDRSWDDSLPWNGRVSPEGKLGAKPFIKYVGDHYLEKFKKLRSEIVSISKKTGPKKSKELHLHSKNFQNILGRIRGFEKCRGFTTLMAAQNLYSGDAKKVHLDKHGWSPALWRTKVAEILSEGDNCCDDDCDPFTDKSCVPCGPVCRMGANGEVLKNRYGDLDCRAEETYCFDRCSDDACEVQGDCDCDEVTCRPCTGLKSVGRWVAKEMKITMSFDVCGEVNEDGVETKKGSKNEERTRVERQMCSIFKPTGECYVNVAHLIMRGDGQNRVPAAYGGEQLYGTSDPAQPGRKVLWGNQYATVTGLVKEEFKEFNGQRVLLGSSEHSKDTGEEVEDDTVKEWEDSILPEEGVLKKWVVAFSDPSFGEAKLKAENLDAGPDLDTFHHVFGANCSPEKLEHVKDKLGTMIAQKSEGYKYIEATLDVVKWAELYLGDKKVDDDKDESLSRKWAGY